MTRDTIAGQTYQGEMVAGEIVPEDNGCGLEPGIYVTIRLDPDAVLAAGPVAVTYLPLRSSGGVSAEDASGMRN